MLEVCNIIYHWTRNVPLAVFITFYTRTELLKTLQHQWLSFQKYQPQSLSRSRYQSLSRSRFQSLNRRYRLHPARSARPHYRSLRRCPPRRLRQARPPHVVTLNSPIKGTSMSSFTTISCGNYLGCFLCPFLFT